MKLNIFRLKYNLGVKKYQIKNTYLEFILDYKILLYYQE